jgi:putative hydrolase of HD superfamily
LNYISYSDIIFNQKKGSYVSKEENVIKYYVMCNKLKNVIRTGWKNWNVERERVESVAEHIFGVQMLAIAMKSEYEYDIDIMKVVFMLAVHELGEIVIGDLTMFEISKEEKAKREKEAVHKILCGLLDGKEIENLFTEFDSHSTKEAMFAYQCDKLECDLQSKLYDEEGCVDLNKQENNDSLENELVKKLLSEEKSWSGMWLRFGQTVYPYDDNFKNVSKYALNNNISKKGLNK